MFADLQAFCRQLLVVTGLLAAASTAASAAPVFPSQKTSPAQEAQIAENYGKLALSFEANTGRADGSVKFFSRGSGYGLYLTRDGAVLTLREPASVAARFGLQRKLRHLTESVESEPAEIVRMQLASPGGKAEPTGEEPLSGTVNYFIGDDPSKWHTSIPTYARVRYPGIYPGVDLVYYGNQRQLEYDFVVAPGADPKPIRLRFGGMNKVRLTADGDLEVSTGNGALTLRKPAVYQIVNGDRHVIAGRFALLAKHTVGFRLGSYDRAKELVIDPVLVYSTYLGGNGVDAGNAIAVDSAGNVYVAGQTFSTSFPVTPGAFQTTNHAAANGFNAFVTKLNPTGTALVYSTYLGGSGGDAVKTIALDAGGNVYVAGQTTSTNFPVTQGAFQTTNKAAANGNANAFVSKLNPSGTALVYSTYLGGSGVAAETPYGGDAGNAIAVDTEGNAYVTGRALSADFPVTQGAFQTINRGTANDCANVFVTKLNPAGAGLVYSTYLGGSGGGAGVLSGDTGYAVAVDAAGGTYVAGNSSSTDYPVTPGAYQTTNHSTYGLGGYNAFVTELDAAGSGLVYSTYLGGSNIDSGSAVALDTTGDLYVAGETTSADFPVTSGAYQTTNHGAASKYDVPNAFVTKLNPTGTELVYSTYLGGTGGIVNESPSLGFAGGDQASGLAIDGSGSAYVAGSTASADFPVTQGAYQAINNDQPPCPGGCVGGYNAFITELNPEGSALVHSTYLGGTGINPYGTVGLVVFGSGEQANALALDSSGNIYVTGSAASSDFPVTAGVFQTTIRSPENVFVAKLSLNGTSNATTPTVTVTPALASITSGQMLPVTISVSGASGSPTPTGTVTLASGTYASAVATLSGGSATIDIPGGALLGEPYPYSAFSPDLLAANYIPDAASSSIYNFASGLASVQVLGTVVWVTPSAFSINSAEAQSQPVSLGIVVTSGPGYPTPTGEVTLTDGSYTSAAATLTGGNATITVPAGTMTTGFNFNLIANYLGDNTYAGVSEPSEVYVNAGTLIVSVVPSSTSITTAQALSVTITVSAGNGNPTPTGTVGLFGNGYYSGSYFSGSTALTNGSATITIPAGSLPAGFDTLQADFDDAATGKVDAVGIASVTVVSASGSSFAITGTAVTLKAGATTGNTSTITVTPSGGFTGGVMLTAAITSSPTGAQDLPTLSFGSTSPVNIIGANAGTATLTITTTAAVGCTQAFQMPRGTPWYTGGGAGLFCAGVVCVLLFGVSTRRRSWQTALGTVLLLVALAAGFTACGGGSSSCSGGSTGGTTPGTYTITVTGSSGTNAATGTVTLSVQ